MFFEAVGNKVRVRRESNETITGLTVTWTSYSSRGHKYVYVQQEGENAVP